MPLRTLLATIIFAVIVMGLISFGVNYFSASSQTLGCESISNTGLIDPSATVAFFRNQSISPLTALTETLSSSQRQVLGSSSEEKWIEIDLSDQKLIAHQGDTIFLESPISSGLSFPTPEGTYNIWYKIRFTKMEGGSKANNTYYYLPNVPYSMFFHGNFGIHGTYWHNNFGHRMSHGCVNSPTPVAEKLFYWVGPVLPDDQPYVRATPENPGTKVVVHP
jgi:hypothetical protein